jgi:hypothetical protein
MLILSERPVMGKGGDWEREVAKTLTTWLTGSPKPYVWWRMPSSGAMATISEENKELSGDLIALRPEGAFLTDKYSVECKVGYPSSSFHKHLKGVKNDEIKDFWEQCCNDANKASKKPLLIYKKKMHNALIGIEMPDFEFKLAHLPCICMRFSPDQIGDVHLPDVAFYDMKEFLKAVSPDDVRNIK